MRQETAAKIEAAVAQRLGIQARVLRWAQDPHGVRVPVVQVPAHKAEHARALGLVVEVQS